MLSKCRSMNSHTQLGSSGQGSETQRLASTLLRHTLTGVPAEVKYSAFWSEESPLVRSTSQLGVRRQLRGIVLEIWQHHGGTTNRGGFGQFKALAMDIGLKQARHLLREALTGIDNEEAGTYGVSLHAL